MNLSDNRSDSRQYMHIVCICIHVLCVREMSRGDGEKEARRNIMVS